MKLGNGKKGKKLYGNSIATFPLNFSPVNNIDERILNTLYATLFTICREKLMDGWRHFRKPFSNPNPDQPRIQCTKPWLCGFHVVLIVLVYNRIFTGMRALNFVTFEVLVGIAIHMALCKYTFGILFAKRESELISRQLNKSWKYHFALSIVL